MKRPILSLGLVAVLAIGCATIRPRDERSKIPSNVNVEDEFCPVHSKRLVEAVEPLFYGKQHFGSDYYEARKRDFPYAFTNMQSDTDAYARVHYCPTCREVEREWQANWKPGLN